jgi:hypothetical protein
MLYLRLLPAGFLGNLRASDAWNYIVKSRLPAFHTENVNRGACVSEEGLRTALKGLHKA